jgi:hypothetical protein
MKRGAFLWGGLENGIPAGACVFGSEGRVSIGLSSFGAGLRQTFSLSPLNPGCSGAFFSHKSYGKTGVDDIK